MKDPNFKMFPRRADLLRKLRGSREAESLDPLLISGEVRTVLQKQLWSRSLDRAMILLQIHG